MKKDMQYLEAVRTKKITPLEIRTAQLYDSPRKESRRKEAARMILTKIGKWIDKFLQNFRAYKH